MSEYDELVRDLNDLQVLPPMECIEDFNNAHDRKLYGRAADAIEALVKERDGARAERDQADRDRAQAKMGRAELLLRAEKAEAEVERLKAALHSITLSYEERCGIDHATLARSALEAKP